MKKFLSLLLSLLLFQSLAGLVLASEGALYAVTADFAPVYKSPAITSEKLAEIPGNTYVRITEIRSNAFGRTALPDGSTTGWIPMDTVTAVIQNGENTDIKGIKTASLPVKLTYEDGEEELDLTGLSVVMLDAEGNEAPVTGYNVFSPEMKGVGKKEVIITYSPDKINTYKTSFTVEVIREAVKAISIVGAPITEYMEHKPADFSSLRVLVEFEDESKNKTVGYNEIMADSNFTFTSCCGELHGTTLNKGQHTFTISYKYPDISCSFTVDVTPRRLIGLTVKQQPDILTVYDNTKHPAIDGLILEASYDNGETEDIYHYNCKTVCEPSEFVIGPGNEVKVYFGELYVSVYFRYTAKTEIQGIKLKTPVVLTFLLGEKIDLSELRVYLYYTDGTFREVKDYEISEIDNMTPGSRNIAVTYEGYSEVFTIIISPYWSKGDVDGNGKITASDARQVLRASVGLVTLEGKTLFAGDADRNGKISSADARLILRASVGLENLYVSE